MQNQRDPYAPHIDRPDQTPLTDKERARLMGHANALRSLISQVEVDCQTKTDNTGETLSEAEVAERRMWMEDSKRTVNILTATGVLGRKTPEYDFEKYLQAPACSIGEQGTCVNLAMNQTPAEECVLTCRLGHSAELAYPLSSHELFNRNEPPMYELEYEPTGA